jgi:hypothetical protein
MRTAKKSPLEVMEIVVKRLPNPTTSMDRGSNGMDITVEGRCKNLLTLQIPFFHTRERFLGVVFGDAGSLRSSVVLH